jgi:hypothetical protein
MGAKCSTSVPLLEDVIERSHVVLNSITKAPPPAAAPAADEVEAMPASMRLQVVYTEMRAKVGNIFIESGQGASIQRRIVRLVTLLLCIGLLGVMLYAFHLPVTRVSIVREWDARIPLYIEVSGCDVHVMPSAAGSAPTVEYHGLVAATSTLKWTSLRGETISALRAHSSMSCEQLPFLSCALACEVTVSVPEGVEPKEIHVSQDIDDKSPVIKLQVVDVALRTLRVRGAAGSLAWCSAGPTIGVRLMRSRIRTGLLVALDRGSLRCDECEFYAATVVEVVVQHGNIELDVAIVDGGADVVMGIRQPMGAVCIAAEAPTRAAPAPTTAAVTIRPPADPWAACAGDYFYKLGFSLYDTDRDSFINRAEFLAGLEQIPICCGATTCPFAGWCDPLSWQLFPSVIAGSDDSGLTGRADVLTNAAFLGRLRAKNWTHLLPRCAQFYTVSRAPFAPEPLLLPAAAAAAARAVPLLPPPAPLPNARWDKVHADDGQVHIALRAPTNASTWSTRRSRQFRPEPYASSAWPPLVGRAAAPEAAGARFAPAERYPGIRMLRSDAKALQAKVGPLYGDPTSRCDAFIVFDVPAAPGVPRSLWVYSPLPVYYLIGPATLAHISMGAMVPELLRFRVRFHDTSCDGTLSNGTLLRVPCTGSYQSAGDSTELCEELRYEDQPARFGAIQQQLERALLSNGRDVRRPRGQVLLVSTDPRPVEWWEFLLRGAGYSLMQFAISPAADDSAPADVLMSPWVAPSLSLTLHLAVVMSLLAALVVSLTAQRALYTAAYSVMRQSWRDKRSKQRMLHKVTVSTAQQQGAKDKEPKDKDGAAAEAASAASDAAKARDLRIKDAQLRIKEAEEPNFNVFQTPLSFISTIFIEPLQRKYVESVSAFVRDKCHVDMDAQAWQAGLTTRLQTGIDQLRAVTTLDAGPAPAAPADSRADGRAERFARNQWRTSVATADAGGAAALIAAMPAPKAAAAAAAPASEAEAEVAPPPPADKAAAGGDSFKSSYPFADLIFEYELYCFQRGLEVVGSREQLQRELIRTFNCRVHASTVVNYVGCRWKSETPAWTLNPALKPSAASLAANQRYADAKATLNAFIAEHVEINPAQQDWTVVASTAERDGTRTFASDLERFCTLHGRALPTDVVVLYELSHMRKVTIRKEKQRIVYGLGRRAGAQSMLTGERILIEMLTVATHCVLLFGPGLLLSVSALYSQDVYARTTATRMPLLWMHFFVFDEPGRTFWLNGMFPMLSEDHPVGGALVLNAVRLEIFEMLVFTCATILHLLAHYTSASKLSTQPVWALACRVAKRVYGLIFWLHTLGLLLHASLTLTWALLAAVLDPNRFLPAGAAIVVAIVVITQTRRQMQSAAGKLRRALTAGFQTRLQVRARRGRSATREVRASRLASPLIHPPSPSSLPCRRWPPAPPSPSPFPLPRADDAPARARGGPGRAAQGEAGPGARDGPQRVHVHHQGRRLAARRRGADGRRAGGGGAAGQAGRRKGRAGRAAHARRRLQHARALKAQRPDGRQPARRGRVRGALLQARPRHLQGAQGAALCVHGYERCAQARARGTARRATARAPPSAGLRGHAAAARALTRAAPPPRGPRAPPPGAQATG